ncbi:hypothetical protein [Streptomyces sp. NPDC001970]
MTRSPPTTEQVWEIDRAVDDLVRGEAAWAACDRAKRRELLEQMHAATAVQAEAWVRAAVAYKQLPDDSPLVGEEWITGPYPVLTSLGALAATVEALEESRSPVDGFTFGRAPSRRVTVRVLPHSVWDQLLLNDFSAEVWMPPGVTKETVRSRAGLALLRPAETKRRGRRARRGEHHLDPDPGRAVRAVREQPGGGPQAQPGHRRPLRRHRRHRLRPDTSGATCPTPEVPPSRCGAGARSTTRQPKTGGTCRRVQPEAAMNTIEADTALSPHHSAAPALRTCRRLRYHPLEVVLPGWTLIAGIPKAELHVRHIGSAPPQVVPTSRHGTRAP